MIKVKTWVTEILLDVTQTEIESVAKEVLKKEKSKAAKGINSSLTTDCEIRANRLILYTVCLNELVVSIPVINIQTRLFLLCFYKVVIASIIHLSAITLNLMSFSTP